MRINVKLKPLLATLLTLSIVSQTYAAQQPVTANTNNAQNNTASNTNNAQNVPNTTPTTSEDKIVLNFENADIQTVIKAISKLSGKNFVIDPRVKGTVNIVSEKPISKSESYKVLASALRMQGFATVEADGVIKVLPEADARTYNMKTGTSVSNAGDQLVTKVFSIDAGSATQLSNAIRPIVSQNNSISVYPNSNALIVTDYASNISRVTKIINDLNATKSTKLQPLVIKLKYAYASDVSQTLQSYMGVAAGSSGGGSSAGNNDNGPSANITVDAASNSLIITSNNQSKLDDLKKLALSLDADNQKSNNNLHVVYLKNADAAHVAEVLKVIVSGQDNPNMSPSSDQRSLSDTSSMFSGGSGGSGGGSGGSSFSGGGSSKSTHSSQPSGSTQNTDKNAAKILVQAEPTTNSLIIQAPEAQYRSLRSIIDMLDVRRVQVMIEALIADVNTTIGGNFGIQWVGGAGNNNMGAGIISNYGGNGSAISDIVGKAMGAAAAASGSPTGGVSIPNEVYVGLVTNSVTVGGQKIPGISVLADMIASSNAGNVLGRPTLLTLDNEEASIFVGQNIGVPSGSYASTGNNNSVTPFTTVNRQDVGTMLKLKPLVTQSGAIQLSIYQEDSKLDPASSQPAGIYAQNGPNILKRNLKTQILVNDGQIIALGGMTSDSINLVSNGIPLLSSIPYLGWLFSWQSRIHSKQNLVIFLRPQIIRNDEGAKALTNQRYRYILDQQNAIQASGNLLLPRIDPVTLDNQVPFSDSKIPAQPAVTPDSSLIDLTNGAAGASVTPQNTSFTTQTTGNTTVTQQSPNSVSVITKNN